MTLSSKTSARPPVWLWLAITFLWGSVFFATSTWMLGFASVLAGEGVFAPSLSQSATAYLLYLPLLLVVALVTMAVRNRMDPEYRGFAQRKAAVIEGKKERYFVSLASSIATSFLFTLLAAAIHAKAVAVTGAAVELTPMLVLTGAALNVASGLVVSALVGVVILVLRSLGVVKR